MENSQRRTNDNKDGHVQPFYELFGATGGFAFSRYRLVVLCLVLLNAVLLITAVVLGIKCANVKEDSLRVSHSAATELITELDNLLSNHSDVIEAEQEAKMALESAIKNHAQLKAQLEQQKTINDVYQKQIVALQTERTDLQANITSLEGTCGRCLPGWVLLNSSCYFFSSTESSDVQKNWADSRADCVRRGSDLVVIDNPEEQKLVSNHIKTVISGRSTWENGFWVGMTDTETEGTWVWINNVTEVEQRYWFDGEPNNHGSRGGEDCAVVIHTNTNPWKTRFDAKCQDHRLYWLCELPGR